MAIPVTLQNQWLLGESLPGTTFRMCQPVRVVGGPHEGMVGELISLAELEPEPLYHLETSNGEDHYVLQQHLAPLDPEP